VHIHSYEGIRTTSTAVVFRIHSRRPRLAASGVSLSHDPSILHPSIHPSRGNLIHPTIQQPTTNVCADNQVPVRRSARATRTSYSWQASDSYSYSSALTVQFVQASVRSPAQQCRQPIRQRTQYDSRKTTHTPPACAHLPASHSLARHCTWYASKHQARCFAARSRIRRPCRLKSR
jgi:hypothetical protein